MSAQQDTSGERAGIGALEGLELWCVDLVRSGPALREAERLVPRLSDEDRAYASGWKDTAVAGQRLLTRMALRLLLERAAGARWRGVPFEPQPHGKPYLPNAPVVFSVSHVADLALIGVAPHGIIGVDVERSRIVHMREPRRSSIEAAAAALNAVARLEGSDDQRFLQAWVRLEALAKAEGGGIGRLLTRLGITGPNAGVQADWQARAQAELAAAGVSLLGDLALGEGLYAAVATGPSGALPEVRWLPAEAEALEQLVR